MYSLKIILNTMKTNGRIQLFPVLRLAVFLVLGIIAGNALYGVVSVHTWFVVLFCSTVFAAFLGKYGVAQTVMLFVSFVFLGGCLTAHKLDLVNIDFPDDEIEYEGVLVSSPSVSGKIVRCDIVVTDMGRPFKVKASIFRDERACGLKAGDGIRVLSLLEKPRNFVESDFDYRTYLLHHGFAATTFIYIDDWHAEKVDLSSLSVFERTKIAALAFRNKLLDRFKRIGLDWQDYAVLAAMALGERVSMSKELTDDYSVSGALHVLSLSGMHLSIIYTMLLLLFLRRRRAVLAQVLIVCAIWSYVFVVGMPVSAVRSAIMLSIYSFVSLLNRDHVSLNALAVSAVVILVDNPLCIYDVGFQMSFVSVFFILVFYRPFYRLLPSMVRSVPIVNWIWQMSVVSLSAQLGVAPLVAFYFGRFSCYFLLSNFIVVPVSAIILYGVFLMMFTSWWTWGQDVLCQVLSAAVKLMNAGVSYVASLPGSSIDGIRVNVVQVLMFYVSVFSLYVLFVYMRKMLWMYKK